MINPHDIIVTQRNSAGVSFTHPVISYIANSFIMFGDSGSVISLPTQSFTTVSSSYSLSSSWAPNQSSVATLTYSMP
jgi:hypothetical protein